MYEKNREHFVERDRLDENHISKWDQPPMRKDAFAASNAEKIAQIERHFKKIMEVLGLDLKDDSLKGTPRRVAKMFVEDLFVGLDPAHHPDMSSFENNYRYGQMLTVKDIALYSTCEHHFLPIVGRAHVGYISNGRVIGLSKINRIADHYARRPQVQERLTMDIVKAIQEATGTADVACVIDAKHLCVNSRGIRDIDSSTVTMEFSGVFKKDPTTRREFLEYIQMKRQFKV